MHFNVHFKSDIANAIVLAEMEHFIEVVKRAK